MHNVLTRKFVSFVNYFYGFFEVFFKESFEYKYTITSITIKQEPSTSIFIKYRVIGSRQIFESSVFDLNTTNLFASFRPDHAQMIVSMATVESLLLLPPGEIKQNLFKYVQCCATKISR